jgi:pimeloyl-ACP methyl ester carboxylesterase
LATRVWANRNNVVSSDKGKSNYYQQVILLMVHGAGWHSGYFGHLAEQLVASNRGIFVAAYDQPSCGYSPEDQDAPTNSMHVYSIDELVEEVYEAVDWARKEAKIYYESVGEITNDLIPLILLGESFGAIQVLSAALFHDQRKRCNIAGIIVLGALIRPVEMPPPLALRIIHWMAPYYAKLKMPAMDSSTFDQAFGDPEWARIARRDPHVQVSPRFTLGAASAILSGGETLLDRAKELRSVPILAIHGRNDCRTQCQAVVELVAKIGPSAELVIIETTGHQLLQDQPEIISAVIDKVDSWIRHLVTGES